MLFDRRKTLLCGIAMAGCATRSLAESAERLDGEWFGAIDLGSQRLRLKLVFANEGANLFSLDQGNTPIPSTSLSVRGHRLRIEFESLNVSIEGEQHEGWIIGEFRQGNTLSVAFTRSPIELPDNEPLTQGAMDALRVRVGAPGMAVASSHVSGCSLSLASGVRMLGASAEVEVSDKWHIGSIAKSMTALLVARLVDSGALSWDQTIASVFGDQLRNTRPEYADVSIRQLLLHRSGLPKDLPERAAERFPSTESDARNSRAEFVNLALRLEPVGAPGSIFNYSNCGYVVVGAMLERLFGVSWERLIRQHVFEPLAMNTAGFGAPGAPGLIDQPVGHMDAGIIAPPVPHPPGARFSDNAAVWGPAGTIHASLNDMVRYLAAHRDRDPLLSPDSWSVLLTPPQGRVVAMGWAKRGDACWHSGSNTLWYSEAMFDPVRGFVSIAAANDGRIARLQGAVNAFLYAGANTVGR